MKLNEFSKKKEFLICVDSDGCAMDTMDVKHKKCFGPCLITEWGLQAHADEVLNRWLEINLYSTTRGINRFAGLLTIIQEIDGRIAHIEGLSAYRQWVESTEEFSNVSLQKFIDSHPSDNTCLVKALNWSISLNRKIDALSDSDKLPFDNVKATLSYLHKYADIAVVSSANGAAVEDEWKKYGLIDYVDVLLTQEFGSKKECIARMMLKGYTTGNVLMIGDAVGDHDAASANGAFFYPILAKHEKESWLRLKDEAVARLLNNTYAGDYQAKLLDEFYINFQKTE